MAQMKVFKVAALPAVLVPDACYYVKDGAGFIQYLIDNTGAVSFKAKADPTSMSFSRYDLPYAAAANGVMDLSNNQVFKIDASAAGASITMSFTNAPVGKSMVIVVQVTGSVHSISAPVGIVVVDSVDNTLGTVMSVMTFFYDGSKYYLMSNGKVNA